MFDKFFLEKQIYLFHSNSIEQFNLTINLKKYGLKVIPILNEDKLKEKIDDIKNNNNLLILDSKIKNLQNIIDNEKIIKSNLLILEEGTTIENLIENLKNYVAGASAVTSVNGKTGTVVLTATNITGFATVAISGSYDDLSDTPDPFSLNTATTSVLGGVKIGNNISIAGDGTISVTAPFSLNTATSSVVGGVKVGTGFSITGDGTLNVTPATTATESVLGVVKGGDNIDISSTGTISFNGVTITGTFVIENLTPVTVGGTGSGALLVSGGVGIGGVLFVLSTVSAASILSPEVVSSSTLQLSADVRVQVNQSPFKVWNVSTSTRDTISAANGDIIYNTGNNKFQGYANGVWVDLN